MGGDETFFAPPSADLELVHRVEAVEDDKIQVTTVVEAAAPIGTRGIDSDLTRAFEEALRELVGTSSTTTINTMGHVLEASPTNAGSAQRLLTTVPFPLEPIGIGARWTVTTSEDSGGLPVSTVQDITIVDLTATTADATMTVTETYDQGPARLAGSNAQVTVVAGTQSGPGTVTWDLSEVTAIVTVDLDGDIQLEAQAGDRTTQLSLSGETHATVERR